MTPEEAASVKPGTLLCPDHGAGPALCRSGDVTRCGVKGCTQPLIASPDPAAEIVRELAERGPFDVFQIDDGYFYCPFCDVEAGSLAPLTTLTNHAPSCLWRRAKTLYPDGRG